jgi:hypothetical protein
MELLIPVFIIISISFVGFGVGVLFFNKTASKAACGKVPEIKTDDCPSQKAGLCPIEDKTGALKHVRMTKLNYSKLD